MVETFPLVLSRESAWLIQQLVRPGVPLGPDMDGAPVYIWQHWARELREKVNNTILRFEDETETEEVEIDIGREEAWMLDQQLQLDGSVGPGTELIIQIMRGLWVLDHKGLNFPTQLVNGPPEPPQQVIKDMLDTHWRAR